MTDSAKFTATVLLFSGRQNPQWQLTTVQQKKWMVLWQHASLSNIQVQTPSILGYTGCRLQHNQHSHWQLYNGCVSFFEDETVFSKKDNDRLMEMFLLNTAPQEVKEIFQQMKII